MYLSIYSVTSLDFLSPGFLKVVKYRYYRYLNQLHHNNEKIERKGKKLNERDIVK